MKNTVCGWGQLLTSTGLCLVAVHVDAAVVVFDDFDTTAVGDIPAGWTRLEPGDTSVQVIADLSVSSPNSLRLQTDSQVPGAAGSAQATRSLDGTSANGVISVRFDARTTDTTHDALYSKLRNNLNQDLGGIRFDNDGVFAYTSPTGAWIDTTIAYAADTWYSLRIDFNLDSARFSAWVDSTIVVVDAPFRSDITTTNADNFVFQDRVFLGTGESYIDNFQVQSILIPEPTTMGLMLLSLALVSRCLRKKP